MKDVRRNERTSSLIADRCFMSQSVVSQTEEASDPHIKGTDGGREREREREQERGARSQHDEGKLKN